MLFHWLVPGQFIKGEWEGEAELKWEEDVAATIEVTAGIVVKDRGVCPLFEEWGIDDRICINDVESIWEADDSTEVAGIDDVACILKESSWEADDSIEVGSDNVAEDDCIPTREKSDESDIDTGELTMEGNDGEGGRDCDADNKEIISLGSGSCDDVASGKEVRLRGVSSAEVFEVGEDVVCSLIIHVVWSLDESHISTL